MKLLLRIQSNAYLALENTNHYQVGNIPLSGCTTTGVVSKLVWIYIKY